MLLLPAQPGSRLLVSPPSLLFSLGGGEGVERRGRIRLWLSAVELPCELFYFPLPFPGAPLLAQRAEPSRVGWGGGGPSSAPSPLPKPAEPHGRPHAPGGGALPGGRRRRPRNVNARAVRAGLRGGGRRYREG